MYLKKKFEKKKENYRIESFFKRFFLGRYVFMGYGFLYMGIIVNFIGCILLIIYGLNGFVLLMVLCYILCMK